MDNNNCGIQQRVRRCSFTITEKTDPRSLILCGLFSALIAIGAFIKVPVPVVPFTLQFLFTNLAGLLLGPRLGSLAVAVYIAAGLLGVPVFSEGGGLGYIFQPTFGYLLGFYIGTYVVGKIAFQSSVQSFNRLLFASLAALAIVYLTGILYYYGMVSYYIKQPIAVWSLVLYCLLLPLPGDLAICFASALLGKRLIPIIKRGV